MRSASCRHLPMPAPNDIKILATDINTQVLATGRRGVYPLEDLSSIPLNLRNSWTETSGDHFEFDEAAKRLISFKPLNLIEPWPMKGQFNVIFCRNVMIYFSQELQTTLWDRFAAKLVDDGMIYIGHSERVVGPAIGKLNIEGPTALSQEAEGGSMTPIRVLIVDDSRTMQLVMAQKLSAEPDIEVIGFAGTALEAREKIKVMNPDVITLDVEMPEMNGIEFLRRIMKLRPMPVVMVFNAHGEVE